jgi:peptidoglycan hydrolase-like protein with peptidoglycan-binding domain
MEAMEGLVSLLSGEAFDAWIARKYNGQVPGLPVAGVPDPVLREGMSGPAVLTLQVYLNGVIGAGLVEDGDFGPATTTAVRELQRRAGITTDGVYGDDSADALRSLLEDDMSWDDKIKTIRGQGVSYADAEWPAGFMLASNHYYTLRYGQAMLAEQAKQTALMSQLVADRSDLTEEAIAAAVAEGVRQAVPSPEELAAAVAAAVDHDLDTEAVVAALREVLGGLDGAGE